MDSETMPLNPITNNHQHRTHNSNSQSSNEFKVSKPKTTDKRKSYKYGQYPNRKRINEHTSPTPIRSLSGDNEKENYMTNGTSLHYTTILTTPTSKRATHKSPASDSPLSNHKLSSSSPFVESPAETNKSNIKQHHHHHYQSPSLSTTLSPHDEPHPGIPDCKFDDFEIGRILGKGKLGKVYCAKHKPSGYLIALKVMSKKELSSMKLERNFRREIEIQSSLYHVNITHLHTWFHDDTNVYLVLEFSLYGELYQELRKSKRFDNVKASYYIYQVTLALRYLHNKRIIHRDLKPENIMLSLDNIVKLSDFGWSVYMKQQENDREENIVGGVDANGVAAAAAAAAAADDDDDDDYLNHISHLQDPQPTTTHTPSNRRNTICGTMDYLPPEMIEQKPHDKTVDIWALGVLIYEFLVGKPPFEEIDKNATYKRIVKVDLRFPKYLPPPSGGNGGVNDKANIGRRSTINNASAAAASAIASSATGMDLDAIDLIRRLLRYDPSERLKLDDVLRHPWIVKHKPYWPVKSKSK
ncbi:Protein kinase domain family protein [Candida parapsilosis]|uniref:Aurora kinase n=2 Tax=Candida parapsilosis TaxID=5480 RepID=G8B529_CANPC|nr:uncharacterized protein CPAR2_601410 [Candida parapsilosis]KAF6043615.1 Protein kinase domain family protein [Candida parapsilosis]KAF6043887.1 Protein kinase domain family protein [Candida parapsilosis]KAF6045493.1 Protein kinase domain family protein [Candida parapsilosis]KAF6060279.1 Protein kinase domain family protein [Candida parapsilosis]CCE39721.1 hypothetical protein CPAR2_601410 [Candida parapsilosis]